MAEQQYEQIIRKDLILAKESSLVVELFYKGGLRLVDPINIYVDKEGGVSPNRRKFRQTRFSPATIASRSMTCPLPRNV